ncbi:UNVERIFIED_CONTAM: hypothetical protein HDU68_005758, partial [Siphonaria sp. JEL0065]
PVTHATVSGLENVSGRNLGVREAATPTSEPVSSALVETDPQTLSPPTSVVSKVLIAPAPGTLEALMDCEKIQNLNQLCFDIKDQLLKSMNLDDKVEFIEIIGKDAAAVQSFKENASKFLTTISESSVDGVRAFASNFSESTDQLFEAISSIANTNPILKITWLIVSAGYKVFKDAVEEETKFKALAERFAEGSAEFYRLKDLGTAGIKPNVCDHLADGLNVFLGCLIEVAQVYLDHAVSIAPTQVVGTSRRVWSTLSGSTSDKLKSINDKLDDAHKKLSKVKSDGTFEMMVGVVNKLDIVDDKLDIVDETVDQLPAAVAAAVAVVVGGVIKGEGFERVQRLCGQYTEIHCVDEINTLRRQRNPNTRGWIITKLTDSISSGGKLVWLRGKAGTGKSVIAGCVASELEVKAALVLSFFCRHDNTKRNSISAMIQNVAYQVRSICVCVCICA